MHSPSFAPSLSWLVGIGVLVSACGGPGATTPVPEPLSLDPSLVSAPEVVAVLYPSPTRFVGASRAAPANARLRVTNLDRTDPVLETTTNADGSFALAVLADVGNELRFEAIVDGRRPGAVDVRVDANQSLSPVQRPACIELDPGYALSIGARAAAAEIGFRNTCADAITVGNPRSRLGLADFILSTSLPLTIAPGQQGALSVAFTPAIAGQREDVLFVDLTERGVLVRYPFTLLGGAP